MNIFSGSISSGYYIDGAFVLQVDVIKEQGGERYRDTVELTISSDTPWSDSFRGMPINVFVGDLPIDEDCQRDLSALRIVCDQYRRQADSLAEELKQYKRLRK